MAMQLSSYTMQLHNHESMNQAPPPCEILDPPLAIAILHKNPACMFSYKLYM